MSSSGTRTQRRSGAERTAVSLGALVLVYGLVLLFSFHDADPDVWGRLAVGRLIAERGSVPTEDVFAYVPTKSPWVDHEWLSGVVFHAVWERWSGRGLILLRLATGLAAWIAVYAAARVAGGAPFAVAFLGLSNLTLFTHGANGVVRAQAFSFLFFGLFLLLLERARRGPGHAPSTLLLLPATALWANLHGGFVVGVLVVAVYSFGAFVEGKRRFASWLALLAAACLASSLANPYGFEYWRYLSEALTMPRPEIVEWRPVDSSLFEDPHLKSAALAVLLLLVLGRRASPSIAQRALVAGTLAATLLHIRFAPFLALAFPVGLAANLESALAGPAAVFPKRLVPSLGPLAILVCLQLPLFLGLLVSWRVRDAELVMRVPEEKYPVAAVRRLSESGDSGRLAVSFNWGEYALYHLYPRFSVSIDGRYETVYPAPVVRANFDFQLGRPGREVLFERYPADFALYARRTPAAQWLEASPDWTRVAADELAVLYRHRPVGLGEP